MYAPCCAEWRSSRAWEGPVHGPCSAPQTGVNPEQSLFPAPASDRPFHQLQLSPTMLASDDFDLPDWFIRQLILERPLAAPRLPPELLAPILNHALADQHPAARQKTRGRFRRVCKDWCESVDFWKEVDVVGSAKLHYLARHFVRSQAKKMATPDGPVEAPVRKPALEVKKLYLELDDVDEGGWSLLSLVSEVEELEILSIEGWYLDSNDGGAERTARVFAGLTKVKSFKVGGPSGNAGEWPVLGLSWVRE